jgi:hypothetical protein
MKFLTKTDLELHLGEDILEQISSDNLSLLEHAEDMAIGIVSDTLSGMYDLDAALNQSGTQRHKSLLMWLLCLTAYQLYRQIPDNAVPERIIKEYDDTMKVLASIGRGKTPTTLPPITANGNTRRVFRMGSNLQRGHNPL